MAAARRAPALAALLLLLAAACAPRAADAAVTFNAALWNGYNKYAATGIHANLLFPDNGRLGASLFPLDFGWNVMTDCHGPSRPFPSADAKRAPGACEYQPNGADSYTFWQKLPGDRLRLSNCYCYALDRFEGGWCNPGLGGGMGELSQSSMTCEDLTARVLADGGIKVDRAVAVDGPVPSNGHFIAMWYRPQSSCNFPRCAPDFHFARRDSSGLWSHKLGEAPASDTDSSGNKMRDPQAAKLNGGYDKFCGFFHVDPAKMKIGVQRGGDRVGIGLQRWRDAGLRVEVTPLPYDPAVDFIDETKRMEQIQALQRIQQGAQQAQRQAPAQQPAKVQMLRSAPAAPVEGGRGERAGGRKLLRGAA